ncbi:MAG: leucine-rich repeat domain-containing protein, partial [Lachnospiraceae bacterium]|nr:leucine-rich repeat domain-containing protein [Lachnospiraceae bacterium]
MTVMISDRLPAGTVQAEKSGDYSYDVNDDGTVTIRRYTGSATYTDTAVIIPEALDGKKVTGIGGYAFRDCYNMISITIPSSVTSIGGEAFYNCGKLTSITIPSGVTSIEGEVFAGCGGLTSITIPSGVTSIGEGAFSGCSSLTSITLPS